MKLTIGFVNDVHGYMEPHKELFYDSGDETVRVAGGYARIASIFTELKIKNPDTLFFDGGDTFHGTLPVIASKGEILLPILNQLGFSAMVGHWDFAYGPKHLKSLVSKLSYPLLGINVYNDDGSLFTDPYYMCRAAGLTIGVIGICCNIIDKTMPKQFSEGIRVTDGMAELPKFITEVKERGADIIILLSHNGFPQDMHMLSVIPGVDICLSSHTHNRLYEPVKVNESIVIQCGCHGSFVGVLDLDFNVAKKMESYTYELRNVSESIVPDETVARLIEPSLDPYKEMYNTEVGFTSQLLHRYNTLESSMDDFLLSAIQKAAGSDIAFSNGWRYGAPIDKGAVTEMDLYNIIPMNPPVSTVELNGSDIFEMLEENFENTFSCRPMQQMGGYIKRCLGLEIKMRIENPKGHRLQEIYFNGDHLSRDETYRVAFVTAQGVAEKYGTNRKDLDYTAINAMKDFLSICGHYEGNNFKKISLV